MDRLTIIPSDGAVYVDMVALDGFDLSFIPNTVHALQWKTNAGWIENIAGGNTGISQLPDWATQAMALWQIKWDEINQPPVTPPLTVNDFIIGMQMHFDSVAREKDYDGALSIASYVLSTNPTWKAESEAFIAWRDQCWQYGYQEFAKFQSGERQMVPVNDFIAELPLIVWPD